MQAYTSTKSFSRILTARPRSQGDRFLVERQMNTCESYTGPYHNLLAATHQLDFDGDVDVTGKSILCRKARRVRTKVTQAEITAYSQQLTSRMLTVRSI
jgi:hypothetical protein